MKAVALALVLSMIAVQPCWAAPEVDPNDTAAMAAETATEAASVAATAEADAAVMSALKAAGDASWAAEEATGPRPPNGGNTFVDAYVDMFRCVYDQARGLYRNNTVADAAKATIFKCTPHIETFLRISVRESGMRITETDRKELDQKLYESAFTRVVELKAQD